MNGSTSNFAEATETGASNQVAPRPTRKTDFMLVATAAKLHLYIALHPLGEGAGHVDVGIP